jgi:hypothetical protein
MFLSSYSDAKLTNQFKPTFPNQLRVSSHQLQINTVHKQHIEKQIPENMVKHSLLFKNVLEAYQPQTSENGSQTQFTAGGMHTCHEILEKMHDMDATPQFLMQILNTVLDSRVQSKGKEEEEGWKYEFLSSD